MDGFPSGHLISLALRKAVTPLPAGHNLDLIAHLDVNIAFGILELIDRHNSFGLTSHVNQHRVRINTNNRTFPYFVTLRPILLLLQACAKQFSKLVTLVLNIHLIHINVEPFYLSHVPHTPWLILPPATANR